MSAYRIASRYSKSLLDLATQQGKLEAVLDDMKSLKAATESNPDFLNMLKSPIIPADKKQSVMKAIFSGKVQDLTENFYKVVIDKKREMFLPEIADAFHSLYNEKNKIASATLTTAVPATGEIMTEVNRVIKTHTQAEQVELKTLVDPALIGGFVLRFEDKLYDASIASKLAKMKKEFSKN